MNKLVRILLVATAFAAAIPQAILAQEENPVSPTPSATRMEGHEKRKEVIENSLIKNLKFENIGPTVFSGRVADIAVNPEDPTIFYVAYASGGLWITRNNGTTFEPVFDHEASMTIGDIAVNWENGVVWVGTGENNSSRSSYAGTGVYKSEDWGDNWIHCGLPESHHIGRIILHPDDSETIWIAVIGHLYSPNAERGIYKTTDGGQSWQQTLFVDNNTGAIDMISHPENPEVLYAATWERTRRAWDFTESGQGSGIYRSDDGGETWTLLTDTGSGFPTGDGVGRIGLDITVANDTTFIFAILDNYFRRPAEEADEDKLSKDALRSMSRETFLTLDRERLDDYVKDNNFPEKYTTDTLITLVENGTIEPRALVEYLEDANSLLFETEVIGAEVYLSVDNGVTWKKTHDAYLDRLYNTYGYYFGQIRVEKSDPNDLYILGVPLLKSDDRGKTWYSIGGDNVHGDHHALWVNPQRPGHLILGNDGGINISYDDGENWIKCNSPSVGQFYSVHADRAKPYNVYGGLQDNGVWGGPHTYEHSTRWHSSGNYPYRIFLGGDGMQVEVDYRDNNTLYTGFQFGNYYRIDMTSGDRKYITPRHEITERPYRWNWQTPIHLSRHQQDILYMGSNFLHRSLDKGDAFEAISPDLTMGGIKGDVPYGTLTAIDESPLQFGLLYTGADDGSMFVSKDHGLSWKDITEGLPEDLYVARICASGHSVSRVYCALNGYRWDDFNAYVFVSEDYGNTWNPISEGLPVEPVNVIDEDPVNQNILYVGTDHGLYISLDRGRTFQGIGDPLPAVPVHDLTVQDEAGHLILGTHGRSFYLADISILQSLDSIALDQAITLLPISDSGIRYRSGWGTRGAEWMEYTTPEISIPFYCGESGAVTWRIRYDDLVLTTGKTNAVRGLNYLQYDLSVSSPNVSAYVKALEDEQLTTEPSKNGVFYLRPGTYTVVIEKDGEEATRIFEVK